jgi:hypothetical protein
MNYVKRKNEDVTLAWQCTEHVVVKWRRYERADTEKNFPSIFCGNSA